jgi:UDP-N-acetylmuramoyl-tripeptide--D-alanyl-D-alanine ligase
MNLSIADLQHIVGGRLRLGEMPPRDGDASVVGRPVCDSRDVKPGDVFWALAGNHHNGAHFAEEALARGASGVVTSGRWVAPWAGRWSLEVADSREALERLANWQGSRFRGKLITIEGASVDHHSVGWIAAVLNSALVGTTGGAEEVACCADRLLVDLVELPSHHDFALFQIGDRCAPRVSQIARLACPDVAVFLTSGADSDRAGTSPQPALAVMERLTSISAVGGRMIVNGDDPHLRRAVQDSHNAILVGRGVEANLNAAAVCCSDGQLRFRVNGATYCFPGSRNDLIPALVAIAIAQEFGLTCKQVANGLAEHGACLRRRGERVIGDRTIRQLTVPARMPAITAAMQSLRESAANGKRVVFCGETNIQVASLTTIAESIVSVAGADWLIAVGSAGLEFAKAAQRAGMPQQHTVVCFNETDAWSRLVERLGDGDALLKIGDQSAEIEHGIGKREEMMKHRDAQLLHKAA